MPEGLICNDLLEARKRIAGTQERFVGTHKIIIRPAESKGFGMRGISIWIYLRDEDMKLEGGELAVNFGCYPGYVGKIADDIVSYVFKWRP